MDDEQGTAITDKGVRPEVDHVAEARAATSRLCALIDRELEKLPAAGRAIAASVLLDEVRARSATKPAERLYPKFSLAVKAAFLHDFARAVEAGAVKKPRYKVVSIDERRDGSEAK